MESILVQSREIRHSLNLFADVSNTLIREPGLCLRNLIRQGEALWVFANVMRCPNENPKRQGNEHRKGVQKIEIALMPAKIARVTEK